MGAVTTVTSLGLQTTQWSVKRGVFDDFWHYCDELETRLDTVVCECAETEDFTSNFIRIFIHLFGTEDHTFHERCGESTKRRM